MRPQNMKTRVFLDGGDPQETKEIISLLGFLDGQTTNPTLISKNPSARSRLEKGVKFTKEEVFNFYNSVVKEIYSLIPQGSISVEVYADASTSSGEMVKQGKEMFSWIPNAHIKFPTTEEGLQAAEQAIKDGLRVNMTLCFTQDQAAAVYSATAGAKKGDVFVSPFIGRLDDKGENGMDLIANIIKMFEQGDGHVEVLTASVRTLDHFLYALWLGTDIITAPFSVLKKWHEQGLPIPGDDYVYNPNNLSPIHYKHIVLAGHWNDYNIQHTLTDTGIEKFSSDWNALIQ